jgi:DNA-binding XRE family transcriptional regulator
MANPQQFENDVRKRRTMRGWSQEQLAHRSGLSRAGISAIETDRLDLHTLPGLRIAPSDPQASWLHGLTTQGTPPERLALLHRAPGMSPEVHLAICRAALAAGQPDLVDSSANAMLRVDPWEWRAVWMQGLSALQQGDPRPERLQRGLRPGPR